MGYMTSKTNKNSEHNTLRLQKTYSEIYFCSTKTGENFADPNILTNEIIAKVVPNMIKQINKYIFLVLIQI
jgi:hypothetical protein